MRTPYPFFQLVHLLRLTPCKLPAQRLQAAGRLQLRGEGALPAPQTPPKAHNWNELIVRKRRPFSWLELSAPVLERGGGDHPYVLRMPYLSTNSVNCSMKSPVSKFMFSSNFAQCIAKLGTKLSDSKVFTAKFRFSYFFNELSSCPTKDMLIISEHC